MLYERLSYLSGDDPVMSGCDDVTISNNLRYSELKSDFKFLTCCSKDAVPVCLFVCLFVCLLSIAKLQTFSVVLFHVYRIGKHH